MYNGLIHLSGCLLADRDAWQVKVKTIIMQLLTIQFITKYYTAGTQCMVISQAALVSSTCIRTGFMKVLFLLG